MAHHVASISGVSVPLQLPNSSGAPDAVPSAANDLADSGRLRLTIEAVGDGRFVYKVLDRVTGEVVRQLPREDIERRADQSGYSSGQVVDTKI